MSHRADDAPSENPLVDVLVLGFKLRLHFFLSTYSMPLTRKWTCFFSHSRTSNNIFEKFMDTKMNLSP